ncbi:MAG: hypothetical protein ABEJ31_00875 [Haloarculaceae archaeon]
MADTDGGDRDLTRRTVLAGSAALAGAGLAPTAGAVQRADGDRSGTHDGDGEFPAVILETVDEFDQEDLPGFFVHTGRHITPTEAQVSDRCDFAGWPAAQTVAYDVAVVDTVTQGNPAVRSTLYVPDRVQIDPGTLYVVDDVSQCSAGYLGIHLTEVSGGMTGAAADPLAPPPAPARTRQSPDYTITTKALIPMPQQYTHSQLPGIFVHLAAELDPLQAQVADRCGYGDWPPGQTRAYDARLIDVKDESTAVSTTLYVPDRRDLDGGELYVINDVERCPSGYVGLQIEQIVGRRYKSVVGRD